MGYRSIRALNENHLSPNQSSAMHAHRDVEILTFVMEGELTLESITGAPMLLTQGQVHLLSAGTGVLHKEINRWQEKRPVRTLEVWFMPAHYGVLPSEAVLDLEKASSATMLDGMRLVASPEAKEGSLLINQDVFIWYGKLQKGETLKHPLSQERYSWIQSLCGCMSLNTNYVLWEGDGGCLTAEQDLDLVAQEESSFFFFDLA